MVTSDPPAKRALPIFLVGMMGSGKSTVGRRLAQALGRPFIDADREIETRCGVPISTIFEVEGEDGFRRREAALIDEFSERAGAVLATGGGAVLSDQNRRLLRERGMVIYLSASVSELWHRLRHDKVRPLLRTPNPRERIAELVGERDPLYRDCAHLVVQTGRQSVDRVVDEILRKLDATRSPSDAAGAA
ncbi:MAG: shikimate kinase [Quisquiliibacterium sp.]